MWVPLFSALLGALVGGLLSVVGAILIERPRRAADGAALSVAMVAEIRTLISIFESRGYFGELERVLQEFRADKRRHASLEIQFSNEPFPIFHANRDKVGLLPPAMVADVVTF